MKVDEIEFINNDIYFMDVLEEVLVVNDNYRGILIFDSELRQIARIDLLEDFSIYSSLKKGKELLLICPENGCFIYIDLNLRQKKIIELAEFDNLFFSPIYDWNKEKLILVDSRGCFIKVDFSKGCLTEIHSNCVECQMISDNYAKLKRFKVLKNYIGEKEALIEFSDLNLRIIGYDRDIQVIKEIKKEQYHDFEWWDDYIVKIGEDKVEGVFRGRAEIYWPSKGYEFLRGKIMLKNGEVYLFLLSSSKMDSKCIKIEKHKLETD